MSELGSSLFLFDKYVTASFLFNTSNGLSRFWTVFQVIVIFNELVHSASLSSEAAISCLRHNILFEICNFDLLGFKLIALLI